MPKKGEDIEKSNKSKDKKKEKNKNKKETVLSLSQDSGLVRDKFSAKSYVKTESLFFGGFFVLFFI